VHDLAGAELGCFGVELTAVGRADPIFGRLPHTFLTNMGHHDRVTRLPESAVELARNASQPNQALRIRDRPIYGTQFHSELNAERERERLYEYRNEYRTALPSDEHFDHVIASLAETTEADALLSHFIDEFVLQ
jgi:GMP synthase (glutamine-hydrolysing)